MPCYSDYGPSYNDNSFEMRQIRELRDTIDRRNAMMCAIFRAAEKYGSVDPMLAALDYKECGLGRETFETWWTEHQEEDRVRRERIEQERAAAQKAREAKIAEKARKAKKKEFLASLTQEQRDLLGE